MHIALVTIVFPPDNGWDGIGTYVFHMSRGLLACGHRVTVICGMGQEEKEVVSGNLRILRRIMPNKRCGSHVREQVAALLGELMRKDPADVVEFAEYGASGVVFQRLYPDVPTVVKLHGNSKGWSIAGAPSWKAILMRAGMGRGTRSIDRLERESAERAHVVISPSRWLLEKLLRESWPMPSDSFVVANPFGGFPDQRSLQEKDYSAETVLFLGRLAAVKGANLLPHIFKAVWSSLPTVRFELIGQDTRRSRGTSWREWILDQVPCVFRPQVVMRGGVPYERVAEYLASHSVACFASVVENLPYATMECMSAGIACVVASGGGARELGEDGVSFLLAPRKAEAIASSLVKLLRDPSLRARIAHEAQRRVESEYDPIRISRRMERVYELAQYRALHEADPTKESSSCLYRAKNM